jgi:hypothetical protein
MLRRIKEEPLVPLGMLLTCAALFGAARAIKSQDHARANIMFRRRIYAQGFTLAAVVAGGWYLRSEREKKKEVETLEKERANAERREKWLKELEARDVEDRAANERVRKLLERRRKREIDGKENQERNPEE